MFTFHSLLFKNCEIISFSDRFRGLFSFAINLNFQQHTGRVFRLQFDEFQIVSSSHDDTILIWDFMDSRSVGVNEENTEILDDGAPPALAAIAAAAVPQPVHRGDRFAPRVFPNEDASDNGDCKIFLFQLHSKKFFCMQK